MGWFDHNSKNIIFNIASFDSKFHAISHAQGKEYIISETQYGHGYRVG
jgi:hypothetical protein